MDFDYDQELNYALLTYLSYKNLYYPPKDERSFCTSRTGRSSGPTAKSLLS